LPAVQQHKNWEIGNIPFSTGVAHLVIAHYYFQKNE